MEGTAVVEKNGNGDSLRERLPVSLKLAYGAPAFAGAAMAIPILVLMPRFYSDVILAPLGYIAIAIALARALDALTDPLMGWISDRTRTRWGRRKPYIAFGVPFAAVAFYLLFNPPESLTPIRASLWFGFSFSLYFLFSTIFGIPKVALGAELTDDYNERSSLFGYRSIFIAAGTIIASILPAFLPTILGTSDERFIYSLMAGSYAVLLVVLYAWLLIRVPERPEFAQRESNPLVPGVRRALRNRPFRILLLCAIINAIPAAIPAILMPYFVEYVIQPENPEAWLGICLVIYLGSGLLFVPVWMAVAQKIGKLKTLITNSLIGICGLSFFFFAGPGDTAFVIFAFLVIGIVSMSGHFLTPAMVADVIDYDELRTGRRREAQYSSFLAIIPKFVSIPGSSVPLAILASVGYVPNQAQTPEVLFWIRFMYSIFPIAFFVISLALIFRYPLSEAVHRKIRDGIDVLAEGKAAVDPLTNEHIAPRGAGAVSESDGWFLDHFTPRELRRASGGKTKNLMKNVSLAAGFSLLVCLGAGLTALTGVSNLEVRPPLTTVLAIVVAGLAFTAFIFHCLRLGPARRMTRNPLPDEIILAHLDHDGGES